MGQVRATRNSVAVPLTLSITRSAGNTGLTILLELRDGTTLGAPSYLDFLDDTFKTGGWTTKAQTLTEIGNGHYGATINISSIINLPTLTEHLVGEYRSLGISPGFASQDIISLPLNIDAGVDEALQSKRVLSMASGKIAKSGDQYAYMDETGVNTLFVLKDNDPIERTRIS